MSTTAICTIADMPAVNADLHAAGHGAENFSVPIYDESSRTSHATLHDWGDLNLLSALNTDSRVVVNTSEVGAPRDRVQALIDAQGLKWPGNAPLLPDAGTVMPGEYYRTQDGVETRFWRIIQEFSRDTYPGPVDQLPPAIIIEARIPGQVREWKQPQGQFDAYLTVNPFTGEPDRAIYNGEVIEATSGSAGGPGGSLINVSEPGTQNSGWTAVALADGSPLPEPTGPEPWQPYDGTAGSLYQTGDRATHNGFTWESQIDNNSWEPGAAGTETLWVKV